MSAAAAVSYEYDWTWRKQSGPMTFRKLYREAIEVCSPELYLRWLAVGIQTDELYMCGLLDGVVGDCTTGGREVRRKFKRVVEQAFVRAYLFERRAGTPLRAPGPPPGHNECAIEARASVERMEARAREQRERLEQAARDLRDVQRWKMFAAIWAAIGCLMEGA